MAGGSVFISYRRDDSAGEAGRLADHLTRRFGPHAVFIDIDTIAPGTDFVIELERAVGGTAVVIVVIGRRWLTVTNADGSRRIDNSADFVRREVEAALRRGIRVIPVLVQGAAMPTADELPKELAPLATKQAIAIQHEEFSDDAQRLADAIAPLIEGQPPQSGAWRRRALLGGALAAVLLGLAGWQWFGAAAAGDGEARARQQQVDDLVRIAGGQQQRRQFPDAIATLDRAVIIDADVTPPRPCRKTWRCNRFANSAPPMGRRLQTR
jgi:hypothetical protein